MKVGDGRGSSVVKKKLELHRIFLSSAVVIKFENLNLNLSINNCFVVSLVSTVHQILKVTFQRHLADQEAKLHFMYLIIYCMFSFLPSGILYSSYHIIKYYIHHVMLSNISCGKLGERNC